MIYPFYNPREAGGATLETMLVGRQPLLEEIQTDLRRQATSASRQHWLLRGPRGIGKTHLIGMIYHRVHEDSELKDAYLPVWLPEMEAYTVYSTAMLLLGVAEQLVEELRVAADQTGAETLKASLVSLEAPGDDPALFEEVFALLQGEAQRQSKILLVLMENLDAMLAGFRSRPEARRFRAVLSQEKELLFLSTTPTRYLRHLSDPQEPLYGHLKERSLEPLTEAEAGELFSRYLETMGKQGLEGAVGAEGEGRVRRRVLSRLTGGNPRALVMAFSVLSGTGGVRSMVEELEALLDAQTAYFEARLAGLAPRERSIVASMALAPTNLTRQEIARATRLPERSLSTQLKRLLEEGHVGQTVGEGGKGTIYELSDGLFRVWFQYRKGCNKLEPLVRFLALWYAPEELERTRGELEEARAQLRSQLDLDSMAKTVFQVEQALRFARSEEGRTERMRLWADVAEEAIADELAELAVRLQASWSIRIIEAASHRAPISIEEAHEHAAFVAVERRLVGLLEGMGLSPRSEAVVLGLLVLVRCDLGQLDEALETNRELIERYGDCGDLQAEIQEPLARVLFFLGEQLLRQGRYEEAALLYREIVGRGGESNDFDTQEYVARALSSLSENILGQDPSDKDSDVLRKTARLFERNKKTSTQEEVTSTSANLRWFEEIIIMFCEVIERFEGRENTTLQMQMARALILLGRVFEKTGDHGRAAATYRDVIFRYNDCGDLAMCRLVALASKLLGWNLQNQNRFVEAAQSYLEIVDRYESTKEPDLLETVTKAVDALDDMACKLSLKVGLEARSKKEAIRNYHDFVNRLEATGSPELQVIASSHRHILTALEAALPRCGARGKKGPGGPTTRSLGASATGAARDCA